MKNYDEWFERNHIKKDDFLDFCSKYLDNSKISNKLWSIYDIETGSILPENMTKQLMVNIVYKEGKPIKMILSEKREENSILLKIVDESILTKLKYVYEHQIIPGDLS